MKVMYESKDLTDLLGLTMSLSPAVARASLREDNV